jgi:hypothetical protein
LLLVDGTNEMSASIDMAGNRLEKLGDPDHKDDGVSM